MPAAAHADGGVGGGGVTTPTVPIRTTPTTTTAPPPVPPPVTTTVGHHDRPDDDGAAADDHDDGDHHDGADDHRAPACPEAQAEAGRLRRWLREHGHRLGHEQAADEEDASDEGVGRRAVLVVCEQEEVRRLVHVVRARRGRGTRRADAVDADPPSGPDAAEHAAAPGFAENLAAAAARSHVDWASDARSDPGAGSAGGGPRDGRHARRPRLAAPGGGRELEPRPRQRARSSARSRTPRPARSRSPNYYNAVGLTALVRGLDWAKPGLQQKILDDSRVNIYPGGRNDIATGRVNVRVLATVEYLAQTFHQVTISCLITGHRLYARPGVISAHVYGLAVDVAAVDNVNIIGHQGRGSITEKAIRSILMLPPEVQPNQVISLMALGGPSFALPDHWNHIHIGFSPIPYSAGLGEHDGFAVPTGASKNLLQLWQSAGQTYGVPWQVLAAINKIESNFGQNMGPSSAGAVGWMQFMPSTWARYGHGRERRRQGRPVQRGRRDLLGRALPLGGRRGHRPAPRDLRLQPCAVVRRPGAPAREPVRQLELVRARVRRDGPAAVHARGRRPRPLPSARTRCRTRRSATGRSSRRTSPRRARSVTAWWSTTPRRPRTCRPSRSCSRRSSRRDSRSCAR